MIFSPVEPQRLIDEHLQACSNALLFVGMGIGKTAACLQRINDLLLSCDSIGVLVIAPLRVANLVWPLEVRQWDQFKWMRIANLREKEGQRHFLNGTAHIYVINYDAMALLVSLVERRHGTLPYDVAVYDEGTRAKNPSSKRINLFRRKVPRVPRNWLLTGTPIPNTWLDIFAPVRLVDGGEALGTNFGNFKREYFYGQENSFKPWLPKEGATKSLEQKISHMTLTLKSSDWLDIPDTVIKDIEVPFCTALKEKYKKLEKKLVIELKKDKILNVASAATLVTKLLQFTSGHMYDEQKEVHYIHDLKMEALKRIIKEEKKPVLVASIFRHEQDRIRTQFPQARFFADAKNSDTQTRLLADWNAGNIPILVAHPKSCGHGLNLQHGSSIMVWISLTYSREDYEQMIARIARRGQKDLIIIYRLMVPGTVDDAVATALQVKAENETRLITALQMLESYRTK